MTSYHYSIRIWHRDKEPCKHYFNSLSTSEIVAFNKGKLSSISSGGGSDCREIASSNLLYDINNRFASYSAAFHNLLLGQESYIPFNLLKFESDLALTSSSGMGKKTLEALAENFPYISDASKIDGSPTIIIDEYQEMTIPLVSLLFWIISKKRLFSINKPFSKKGRDNVVKTVMKNYRSYFKEGRSSYSTATYTIFAYYQICYDLTVKSWGKPFSVRDPGGLLGSYEFKSPFAYYRFSGISTATKYMVWDNFGRRKDFEEFVKKFNLETDKIYVPHRTGFDNYKQYITSNKKGVAAW